tara:strand:- start:9366 stop:9596 length:231 start_codon:yes stop_codon:yes gene_type:complete
MTKIEETCEAIGVNTFTLFELAYEYLKKKSDPEVSRMFHNGYLNGSRPPNFVYSYCDAVLKEKYAADWPATYIPTM